VSSPTSLAARHYRTILACLLAVGALSQALVLSQALDGNPFARQPTSDALVYWEWSGRVARGEVFLDTPFLSAPLYPYLLGVLRVLGLSLTGVYVVQSVLHLVTAGLIAKIGRKRFGALEGLVAAGLFLVLLEPAFTTGRLLNGSLQLFLIALVWERLLALEAARKKRLALLVGCLLGLVCLATPPMLVAVPVLALWAIRAAGVSRAALVLLFAGLTIAPATAHNYIVSGECIAISAQAGITYHHGNQAASRGIYTPAEGVSTDRLQQNEQALEVARAELAPDAGWSDASSMYMTRGFNWQLENPDDAAALFVRKFWLFFTARVYGDVYLPSLERSSGMSSRLWLAPVYLAWLLPLAFVVLVLRLRLREERWKHVPETVFLAVPLLVVCFFWYSPRYRLPATPAVVLLAACGVVQMMRNQMRVALGVALGGGMISVIARPAIDHADRWSGQFHAAAGETHSALAEEEAAMAQFRLADAAGDEIAGLRVSFAEMVARGGPGPDDYFWGLPEEYPYSGYVQRTVATFAAEGHNTFAAARLFRRALELDPRDFRSETGLGNVLLTDSKPEEALLHHERAVALRPEGALQHYALGTSLWALNRKAEAATAWQAALDRDELPAARTALATYLLEVNQGAKAIELLEVSDDIDVRFQLSWVLSTSKDASLRDGPRALRIARELQHIDHPGMLDLLASALAETGDFEAAVEQADVAIERLRSRGNTTWADEAAERRAQYAAGKPWRQ